MDIDVTLKVDNEAMMSKSKKSRTVATGWVEVMNCIKFPVFVRTYLDKETQEEKAFVSMPQRKGTKGYTNIISFEDKKIREEVEEAVLRNVLKQAVKAFDVIPIKDTKITLLPGRFKKSSGENPWDCFCQIGRRYPDSKYTY